MVGGDVRPPGAPPRREDRVAHPVRLDRLRVEEPLTFLGQPSAVGQSWLLMLLWAAWRLPVPLPQAGSAWWSRRGLREVSVVSTQVMRRHGYICLMLRPLIRSGRHLMPLGQLAPTAGSRRAPPWWSAVTAAVARGSGRRGSGAGGGGESTTEEAPMDRPGEPQDETVQPVEHRQSGVPPPGRARPASHSRRRGRSGRARGGTAPVAWDRAGGGGQPPGLP